MRRAVIRSILDAIYFTGMHRLFTGRCGGLGAILMLHRVRPSYNVSFHPNRYLEVTPDFLEAAIVAMREQDLETICLDEVADRLSGGGSGRRFVCLTFDDGYRDNREWAYPILKRHRVPFAIYVATDLADRHGKLWWLTLEAAVARAEVIDVPFHDGMRRLPCHTPAAKYAALAAIHAMLRRLPREYDLRTVISNIAERAGVDEAVQTASVCMSWQEIGELAADSLVTIGAHTASHPFLSKLDEAAVRREMHTSAARIEAEIGHAPAHFSYPFGDRHAAGPREFAVARELGFRTAVTTRPGVLYPEHETHRWALPRISLNGEMQRLRHLKVLTSGVATAAWNGMRHLDVA